MLIKYFKYFLILKIIAIFGRVFRNLKNTIFFQTTNLANINLCAEWVFCDLLPSLVPPIARNILCCLIKITFIYCNQHVKMWVIIVTLFVVCNFSLSSITFNNLFYFFSLH